MQTKKTKIPDDPSTNGVLLTKEVAKLLDEHQTLNMRLVFALVEVIKQMQAEVAALEKSKKEVADLSVKRKLSKAWKSAWEKDEFYEVIDPILDEMFPETSVSKMTQAD